MARLRLRTQLFVASLLIICALLGSLLVVVHHIVRSEIVEGVRQRADSSLHAFENVQHERELQLSRTAAMLAELPPLKAVLSTQHALTIQQASRKVPRHPESSMRAASTVPPSAGAVQPAWRRFGKVAARAHVEHFRKRAAKSRLFAALLRQSQNARYGGQRPAAIPAKRR